MKEIAQEVSVVATRSTERERALFRLLRASELASFGGLRWLIGDHLPEDSLATVFGLPGSAKSFLALDWALHITTGIGKWNGHDVQQGSVVYIAAEGIRGFYSRIEAWKQQHEWDGEAGLHFISGPVRLDEDKHIDALIELMKSEGLNPRLIIFDTLARCFGGDDNSARDIGDVVRSMDRLKESLRTTVLLVHHSTKTDTSFRGSGALEGAMDVMVHMQKDGDRVTATCKKQKDAEQFESLTFGLERVGDSRVLSYSGSGGSSGAGTGPQLSTGEHATLTALGDEALRDRDWQKKAALAKVPSGSFDRHRKKLCELSLVELRDDGRYVRSESSGSRAITSDENLDGDGDTGERAYQELAAMSQEELARQGIVLADD